MGLGVLRAKASNDPSLRCAFRVGHGLSTDIHGDFSRSVPQKFLHDFYVFPIGMQQCRVGMPKRMPPDIFTYPRPLLLPVECGIALLSPATAAARHASCQRVQRP